MVIVCLHTPAATVICAHSALERTVQCSACAAADSANMRKSGENNTGAHKVRRRGRKLRTVRRTGKKVIIQNQ